MGQDAVAAFVEQIYVDRFAAITDRLTYKKHPRDDSLCSTLFERGGNIVHVGNGPYFHAIYARQITLEGDLLKLDYRILVKADDPLNPLFEPRQMELTVDAVD